MRITPCDRIDWCHLCGNRVGDIAEVHYADNAEHTKGVIERGSTGKRVRMCTRCAQEIVNAASRSAPPSYMVTVKNRRR